MTAGVTDARRAAFILYAVGGLTLLLALRLRAETSPRPFRPIDRAMSRGEVAGAPHLDPGDAMANAAVIAKALDDVPAAGERSERGSSCDAAPRMFAFLLDGRMSRVHFDARQVCQMHELKRISAAQPGFGAHGLGEVAAFVLGTRRAEDVTVSRIVVPPFRFTGETLTFEPADLGALGPGEQLVGTYHTHPDGDLEEGLLSVTDLTFMRVGVADFHGAVGPLARRSAGLDWLFDIVEPRDGDWNVYAHDARLLRELLWTCQAEARCPLNELRLPGSRFHLLTRYYDERGGADAREVFRKIEGSAGQ